MTEGLLAKFELCDRMAAISRFSRDFMLRRESVLEHIGFCALFGFLCARELQSRGVKIDLGKVLEKATVHDIDEAALGDVPRTTKYFSPEITAAFKSVERASVEALFNAVGVDGLGVWVGAKDDSLEGQLVAVIDLAAVVYKVWTEVHLLQNHSFLRVLKELKGYVAERRAGMAANSPLSGLVGSLGELLEEIEDDLR